MKAVILGLGETLEEYVPSEDSITFGVNDIFKCHPVDYLVCVDRIHRFTPERFKTIANSTHKKFYTHLDEWQGHVQRVQLISLSAGRGSLEGMESEKICYSNNSTYVATVIAYKHGAKEISIFGADFNTHPSFMDNKLDITLSDFKKLFDYLRSKGVKITVTKRSKLYGL